MSSVKNFSRPSSKGCGKQGILGDASEVQHDAHSTTLEGAHQCIANTGKLVPHKHQASKRGRGVAAKYNHNRSNHNRSNPQHRAHHEVSCLSAGCCWGWATLDLHNLLLTRESYLWVDCCSVFASWPSSPALRECYVWANCTRERCAWDQRGGWALLG